MFYDICPVCGEEAELVRMDEAWAYFLCPDAEGDEYRRPLDEFPAQRIAQARDWLYLQATYLQGMTVRIRQGRGPYRQVEVVGHKAECLKTGHPAVRIYLTGYGTMLFGRDEMDRWNKQNLATLPG